MEFDYNNVKSLSDEDFEKIKPNIDSIANDESYGRVEIEDLKTVERMLDLKEGVLASVDGFIQKCSCSNCGRNISLSDRVMTGLVDAGHSKSFILHTMLGNKKILSRLPNVRCMNCATVMPSPASWHFWGFLYCTFSEDPRA